MLEIISLHDENTIAYFIGHIRHKCLICHHNIGSYTKLTTNDFFDILYQHNGQVPEPDGFPFFINENDAKNAIEELNFLIRMVN